ncbi:hypothetical protein AGOR_G00220080 [Albula goreensis]|uniref:Integral membrane protein 2 n=1 Tax=Albula goreensis TaxID=1534307 RepID=A0A8T3CNN8_9TELE|nr:hypothetical protein AGOR_G00220080 [Albula goreensis]
MVKISFNPTLGQKDEKKEEERGEVLIPEYRDLEDGVRVQRQSRVCCWFMCLGLAIMLLVVGGVCVFRYLILQRAEEFCILYPEDYSGELEIAAPVPYRLLQERVQILQDNEVELISVPVPEFADSDPADIVHDFPRKLTAYLDLSLNRCYIIPLNTSIVMPPKDFLELLVNIKAGTYLPQSYLVHEQMMVTERVDDVDQLGYFIYNLCHGKDTYRLQRRDTILGPAET